jgi:hypothetical protein
MSKIPGPTGDFPRGRLDEYDEGGLALAISKYNGTVRFDFGKKVAWFALPPDQAITLAELILKTAQALLQEGRQ